MKLVVFIFAVPTETILMIDYLFRIDFVQLLGLANLFLSWFTYRHSSLA
jgi:hypothetical protein